MELHKPLERLRQEDHDWQIIYVFSDALEVCYLGKVPGNIPHSLPSVLQRFHLKSSMLWDGPFWKTTTPPRTTPLPPTLPCSAPGLGCVWLSLSCSPSCRHPAGEEPELSPATSNSCSAQHPHSTATPHPLTLPLRVAAGEGLRSSPAPK
ncbi:Hypothetical predicted protein [Pelobates cultripes]|uniref:Uncharacterized protein n=1 Tax=Pelobates cultripes TaxID=61616 RepID=A0AAD1R188_PELCU|nr:Hypothetical predicted protein [Pelobates cultripes]